jgi:hypothetical protein
MVTVALGGVEVLEETEELCCARAYSSRLVIKGTAAADFFRNSLREALVFIIRMPDGPAISLNQRVSPVAMANAFSSRLQKIRETAG